MDSVRCSGTETRLTDCDYDADTSEDSHDEDAGVRCPQGSCLGTAVHVRTSTAVIPGMQQIT